MQDNIRIYFNDKAKFESIIKKEVVLIAPYKVMI